MFIHVLLLSIIASFHRWFLCQEKDDARQGRTQDREVEEKKREILRKNKRKGEGEEGVGTVARSAADYLS